MKKKTASKDNSFIIAGGSFLCFIGLIILFPQLRTLPFFLALLAVLLIGIAVVISDSTLR